MSNKIFSGDMLKGKKGIIMGVANDKSIATGIAKAARAQGAELAFTYQGEILKKRVAPIAESLGSSMIYECDVTNSKSIDDLFSFIERKWGKLDFIVHSIAFSNKDELKGKFVDTSLDNFLLTMNVSCYSLTAITQRAEKLMTDGGSIISMTYYGAEKVMPHYNVMGVANQPLKQA